ncbi:MAG: hypothetical protein HUU50_10305 [Candidatus Brocadiae bacterium]|nr:hypothetical protein [Candidatus Brocadiia bacterium]
MSTSFEIKEWHGKEIFCWYHEDAKKNKGKTETFVEIEKNRIVLSEILLDKKKPQICAVFSASYKEEIMESSHMSEAFVVKKGKMIGSSESLQGTLNCLFEFVALELKKTCKQVYLLVPSGNFLYKILNFPDMPDADMKAALRAEIQGFEESKLKDDPSVLKTWCLGKVERKEGWNSNFLLLGIPRETIFSYIEILGESKAAMTGFSTPQMTYFYYLNQQNQEKKQSFIFVELTDYSLRISFFQNGVLAFIRYINLAKWTEESKFIRNVSSQIHHSILYLNQQYPDANLDKFILFNRTSVPKITENISSELEFNIENFDLSAFATYPEDLQSRLEEYHLSPLAALYAHNLLVKNEAIPLPIREFDIRIQNKARFKAAVLFLALWALVLFLSYYQIQDVVASQKKILDATQDIKQKQKLVKQEMETINAQKAIYQARYNAVKKILHAKSRWLPLFYNTIEAKMQNMLFTRIFISPYMTKEEQTMQGESPLLKPAQIEIECKVRQPYATALKNFEDFKKKFLDLYDILAEKADSAAKIDPQSKKEEMNFSLTLKLKKGQQQ